MIGYRIFIPGLAISLTSFLCPNLKSSASNVPLRPPGWVFGIVWPILYITMGVSWMRSKSDLQYTVLTAVLCSWLIAYSCEGDKILGRNILFGSALLSYFVSYDLYKNKKPGFLLSLPLTFWLTFAAYLNFAEVKNLQSRR